MSSSADASTFDVKALLDKLPEVSPPVNGDGESRTSPHDKPSVGNYLQEDSPNAVETESTADRQEGEPPPTEPSATSAPPSQTRAVNSTDRFRFSSKTQPEQHLEIPIMNRIREDMHWGWLKAWKAHHESFPSNTTYISAELGFVLSGKDGGLFHERIIVASTTTETRISMCKYDPCAKNDSDTRKDGLMNKYHAEYALKAYLESNVESIVDILQERLRPHQQPDKVKIWKVMLFLRQNRMPCSSPDYLSGKYRYHCNCQELLFNLSQKSDNSFLDKMVEECSKRLFKCDDTAFNKLILFVFSGNNGWDGIEEVNMSQDYQEMAHLGSQILLYDQSREEINNNNTVLYDGIAPMLFENI